MVVHHAGGVVHGQTDLVLSLAGLGPPQPDFVFTELTGDVRDHLSHVQTFPCAEVSSVTQRENRIFFFFLKANICTEIKKKKPYLKMKRKNRNE